MAKTKSEVATIEEKNTLPDQIYDYGEYANAGFENTSRDDFAAPFIYILQSNSPIVEQGLVDAARPGVLMNTISQELFPADEAKGAPGIAFVPCWRDHTFVEWKPNRGGFVAQHAVDSEVVRWAKANGEFGKLKTRDGNELVETFYVYGLHVKGDGGWEHVLIAFTSTKIKEYKNWMTRLNTLSIPAANGRRIKPPMFAHRFRINTKRQENEKGAYFNFAISFDGNNAAEARLDPSTELFQEAAAFYESCKSGMAKPAYESAGAGEAQDIDGEAMPF